MAGAASFDRFAADYDRFASLERPIVLDWVLGQLPAAGLRALDAGCGSGRFSFALAKRFHEVVGIDISEPLIEIAQRERPRRNVTYRVADLMAFENSAGFDVVFSATTLHHLREIEAALLHLRGLLKPGGTMVLIDNVASRPTPARWVHVLGALRQLPGDLRRLGPRDARWLFGFRTSRPWLEHVASDRYLSRHEFERVYGAAFSGADFQHFGYAHGMVWRSLPD